ncbi:MAG: ribbon-helix-helix domain-containing protein [Pseudomonadota bacterium]
MQNARPIKRSLTLHGHRTSVSLEEVYWTAFKQTAEKQGQTVNSLAAEIDDSRGDQGLASAIRVYLFEKALARQSDE